MATLEDMGSSDTYEIWTVGHSIRAWDEFVAILASAGIEALVDVRRFAGSRRNPQFSGETMAAALPAAGIEYLPMPALGGRRTPRPDSPNTAWRNASFRGYADYMQTPGYQDARQQLAETALHRRTAVMCAEAMWWQCHRSLISDDFKASGWKVTHLQAAGREQEHPYTKPARIVEGRLDYGLVTEEDQGQASLF